MSHPFVKETVIDRSSIGQSPRIDRDFLMSEFSSALVAALKAVGVNVQGSTVDYSARIDCGNGVELFIHPLYGAKMGRVEIASSFAGSKPRIVNVPIPSATYDASRPLGKLALLIKQKHIEPMIPIVAENDKAIADKANAHEAHKALAKEMESSFPGLECKFSNGSDSECRVYFNRDGIYISGTLYRDGHINFQRFSCDSPHKTRAFLAVLTGVNK